MRSTAKKCISSFVASVGPRALGRPAEAGPSGRPEKFGRSHGNAEMTGMVAEEGSGCVYRGTDRSFRPQGRFGRQRRGLAFKPVEFIPLGNDMGETVAEALAPDSQFLHTAITPRRINRNTLTVTLWTYPDSFDAFRQVKKEAFYRLGFAVAAWPLESRSAHRRQPPTAANRPRMNVGGNPNVTL